MPEFSMFGHGSMFDGGVGMFGVVWMILVWAIPLLLLAALLKYLFTRRRDSGSKGMPETLIEPALPIVPDPPIVPEKPIVPDQPIAPDTRTPLDILKAAYARGELSRGEFLQKRDDILEK
jgi:putative membrane protein